MSSVASGLLKKYEPLDTRDFVPFEDYDELSIDNIKDACERFYNAPQNTCDILASDRGPSCNKFDQIKGKKVFFIRFLPPENEGERTDNMPMKENRPKLVHMLQLQSSQSLYPLEICLKLENW